MFHHPRLLVYILSRPCSFLRSSFDVEGKGDGEANTAEGEED